MLDELKLVISKPAFVALGLGIAPFVGNGVRDNVGDSVGLGSESVIVCCGLIHRPSLSVVILVEI